MGQSFRVDRGVWECSFESFKMCMMCDSLHHAVLYVADPGDIHYGGLEELAQELELWTPLVAAA